MTIRTAAGERFPELIIDLAKLKDNMSRLTSECRRYGISVAGVIKGASGHPGVARSFQQGGCAEIASSRLEQLAPLRGEGITLPLMLVRIPMLSEAEDTVRIADISLNSELATLRALDSAAARLGRKHGVILMADLGDLREGWWDGDELTAAAGTVEEELVHLSLEGIGTNLGCYGSILPTREKLEELLALAGKVEERIGRRLRIVSGGATSSFMRVMDGDMPPGINHLRMGEGPLLARDWEIYYGYPMAGMHKDCFTLRAQVIEVKDKPSYPQGETGVDAFGHKPVYMDRGVRRRALLAFGKADCGSFDDVFPREPGTEILGGSSDHCILDVQEAGGEIRTGDVLEFDVDYGSLIYLTASANVRKRCID